MKKKFLFFTILFVFKSYGQIINGIILDNKTLEPIKYATITQNNLNNGVYSNENGLFSFKYAQTNDSLIVNHVSYDLKKIELKEILLSDTVKIFLNKKQNEIEQVFVSKKISFSSIKKIITPKNIKIRTSMPFGYEFCNYIPNQFNNYGKLHSLTLSLNKMDDIECKAIYRVKFYEYDSIKKGPGNLISNKEVLITPLNKTYKLKIELENYKIKFPKNGICIGLEIVNPDNSKKVNSMTKVGPYINFTHTELKNTTWIRFYNKEWKSYTRKSPTNDKFQNAMINVEVKIKN